MRFRHRAAERVRQPLIDLAALGQMVERLGLVEAAHLHRPFDRLAAAADGKAAGPARDRHHAAIDRRRERAVDLDLGLAGRFALLQRGIIEERKTHRALDLERALAGKEYRGRMGVDARDRRAAVGRRSGQKFHDGLLRIVAHGVVILRKPGHREKAYRTDAFAGPDPDQYAISPGRHKYASLTTGEFP